MSSVRKRKKTKKTKPSKSRKQSKSKPQNTKKHTNKKSTKNQKVPLIPLPLIFRLLIASMFLLSIYAFKRYYLPSQTSKPTDTQSQSTLIPDPSTIDMTQIINSADLNLNATKLKDISKRFSKRKKKSIPGLKLWNINDFWTLDTALNLSNQLYSEFMDETMRNHSFYFAINKGNEKIRGNENILQKTAAAMELHRNHRFSYCKYEYRRELPLYQRILSYLNSSYVTQLLSKVLKEDIIGVSDLFVSVYFKNNFLSTHDDRGLGHYAFVLFLSQDWDHSNGGSLNFNCKDKNRWRESCLEVKFKFNQNAMFNVWPDSIEHFVKEVTVDQPRIAITGWYFSSNPSGVHWASIQEETGYGLK